MKMDNKGFTLVELLAVMVILITISLVAVGAVTESLARRDTRECEEQQALAVNAAKIYFSMKNEKEVTVGELKANGYIKEDKKTDKLDDDDKITISSSEYLYEGEKVGESCS